MIETVHFVSGVCGVCIPKSGRGGGQEVYGVCIPERGLGDCDSAFCVWGMRGMHTRGGVAGKRQYVNLITYVAFNI